MLLDQKIYIDKILSKLRSMEANPISVPADPYAVLRPVEEVGDSRENVPFREAVGSLIFLATVSRFDIAFAVNVVSRFLSYHDDSHCQVVKQNFQVFSGYSWSSNQIQYVWPGATADRFFGRAICQ